MNFKKNNMIIIVVVYLFFFSNSILADEKIALVMGNSNYTGDINPLKNAANDAYAIDKRLKKFGFTVISAINKNKEEMLDAIDKFKDHLPTSRIAFVFLQDMLFSQMVIIT